MSYDASERLLPEEQFSVCSSTWRRGGMARTMSINYYQRRVFIIKRSYHPSDRVISYMCSSLKWFSVRKFDASISLRILYSSYIIVFSPKIIFAKHSQDKFLLRFNCVTFFNLISSFMRIKLIRDRIITYDSVNYSCTQLNNFDKSKILLQILGSRVKA